MPIVTAALAEAMRSDTDPRVREAAASALGVHVRSVTVPRAGMKAVAWVNSVRQSLGGDAQILTPAKVREIFHHDWVIHDRRLANAIGFRPRHDLHSGFADTVAWYRRHSWL